MKQGENMKTADIMTLSDQNYICPYNKLVLNSDEGEYFFKIIGVTTDWVRISKEEYYEHSEKLLALNENL